MFENIISDMGNVSDGYHSFDELYEHRNALLCCFMQSNPQISWRSKCHADGSMFDGWFVAGMDLPSGQITYHLPLRMWDALSGSTIKTKVLAPRWDGHTSQDVVHRLHEWLGMP